ncbi:MAG: ankyrin repeat domain-containing protein [Desulfobacterales bacterium]|jgi:hypothetical protein
MTLKNTVFSALAFILGFFCYSIVFSASEVSNTMVFQGATFSAILEEESLKNVIEKFQKETGIWLKAPESELNERVSVQFVNLSIQEGLKRILRTMNYSFLFDQSNNLIGAFIFGKANRIEDASSPSDINEKMVKAAMEGDTAAVVELLAKGADVNAKGRYSGWTPLILAARRGETGLVNFLLSYGADVNEKSDVRNRTAIMEAARNRKVETVKALLTADPDVDAVDWEGYTVLMFAAVSGQSDIVDVLLTHGADVNVKNKVGSSALTMASGYPNVFKKLKAAGAEE